ncbi:26S protease regulatory subunit 6B like [Apostasia shenzhenica]|uniref:26S protease regulatory subunit 6B like n=1 Tax=Apostasia shenzhenica TaxID=1088818 RepID=A0A2I0A788_9ASPA|nr:26S protease regulatory subunit 6B like [Apostasia shenzhenica]
MKEVWTSVASLLGAFAFFQSVLLAVFPAELRQAAAKLLHRAFNLFSNYCYFYITEIDGVSTNELYGAVQLYLSSSASVSASHLSLSRPLNSSAFTFSLSNNDRLLDSFSGAAAVWEHAVTHRPAPSFSWRPLPDEKRGFTLCIRKKDKHIFLPHYLDHIMDVAADIRRRNQDRLLYTNSRGGAMDALGHPWESVPFKHPSTFDTLAMDPIRKNEIMADLRDFAAGESFYRKTGRAWKRGYLLYGPPGTGKSSMIAAMANFLGYDIYDLELTEVHTNSELRKLLMKTTSKSIIVIEDIDCSVSFTNRCGHPLPPSPQPSAADDPPSSASAKSLTLSGLLNFTDGLWSCCGSERIFVFTTNHVDKLDPALLRSGRMDMHIFMSYCSFPALKILLRNYLGLEEGDLAARGEYDGLLRELEDLVEATKITPADVSEVLIKNRRYDERTAMAQLLEVMKARAAARCGSAVAADEFGRKEAEEEEEQEKRALDSPKEESTEELDEKQRRKKTGEAEDGGAGEGCLS